MPIERFFEDADIDPASELGQELREKYSRAIEIVASIADNDDAADAIVYAVFKRWETQYSYSVDSEIENFTFMPRDGISVSLLRDHREVYLRVKWTTFTSPDNENEILFLTQQAKLETEEPNIIFMNEEGDEIIIEPSSVVLFNHQGYNRRISMAI